MTMTGRVCENRFHLCAPNQNYHSGFRTSVLLLPWRTSTGGRATMTAWSGIAPPNAGETSPAQVGLTPLALPGPAVDVATTPSLLVMLRRVSDNLPSSAATLTFSACS